MNYDPSVIKKEERTSALEYVFIRLAYVISPGEEDYAQQVIDSLYSAIYGLRNIRTHVTIIGPREVLDRLKKDSDCFSTLGVVLTDEIFVQRSDSHLLNLRSSTVGLISELRNVDVMLAPVVDPTASLLNINAQVALALDKHLIASSDIFSVLPCRLLDTFSEPRNKLHIVKYLVKARFETLTFYSVVTETLRSGILFGDLKREGIWKSCSRDSWGRKDIAEVFLNATSQIDPYSTS